MQLSFLDRLDDAVVLAVQRLWRYPTLNAAMIVIARYTPLVMLACIAFAGSGLLRTGDVTATAQVGPAASIIAAVAARLLNEPITHAIARRRPFEEHAVLPLVKHESGGSFPSNHATGAFALATGCLNVPGISGILFTLAILLCISRVYCGLHYFTDVWFGALHGLLAGSLTLWIATWAVRPFGL